MFDDAKYPWLRRDIELFLIGVLILYLELVLIRWIGTEIRIFAYLGNLILVICFFGVGLGCYLANRPLRVTRLGVNLLLLATLIANPLHADFLNLKHVTLLLGGFEDSPVWNATWDASLMPMLAGLAVVAALLYLVAFTFVPLGQMLGRAFEDHPRVLRAYAMNIAGSLAGVWMFNALSLASLPPAAWFAGAVVLIALLVPQNGRPAWVAAGLIAGAAAVVWIGHLAEPLTVWSPYQKLTLTPYYMEGRTDRALRGYVLEVNGTQFQYMINNSDTFFQNHPEFFDEQAVRLGRFNTPFELKPHARRVLIVGAGSGNNAAAALRYGAEQVDCVEIDPGIYGLGKQYHPEHPYDSQRVRMVVNDARAFFKQAKGPYDVVWFAWLDSHVLGSTYNNLRLDHYVYTVESFREARQLLGPDGLLFINFKAERPWICDRLYALLREAYGHDPLVYRKFTAPPNPGSDDQFVLVGSNQPLDLNRLTVAGARETLQANLAHFSGNTRPTTDDWPYLYLQKPGIPKLHLVTSLTIMGTVALAGRRVFGFTNGFDWHFFALGAAFLLLEVQTVSRATLLFGMTWVVNAIIISAVLVMILAANLVAAQWPRLSIGWIVGGLAVTVVALAVVPLAWFNALTGTAKMLAAGAFLTGPVFFAGLVFIRSFASCEDRARALGSNLIGALVGGLLESVSFVTGIRALVVLVGVFYFVALWQRPRQFST